MPRPLHSTVSMFSSKSSTENDEGINFPSWRSLLWEDVTDIPLEMNNSDFELKDALLSNDEEATDMSNRTGTSLSAALNLLSSMIGGEILTLPLAFSQAGNGLVGPITLVFMAALMGCSVRCLMCCNDLLSRRTSKQGNVSIAHVASVAFGHKAKYFTIALIVSVCFCTLVGYAVILRTLLQPVTNSLLHGQNGNFIMSCIIMVVTPLTALSSLTVLRHIGAASIFSSFVVACCFAYRSIGCDVDQTNVNNESFRLTPKSVQSMLQALPIFITVFVCHYNVLPVHNEMQNPSKPRTNRVVVITMILCTSLYLFLGTAGSMYSRCTETGTLDSNILNSFPSDDPIMLFARTCLVFIITLAFPMLVIPARNIVVPLISPCFTTQVEEENLVYSNTDVEEQGDRNEEVPPSSTENATATLNEEIPPTIRRPQRFVLIEPIVSILITWFATLVACFVSDITLLWNLVGSSLSIVLAFVIPCGSFLMLSPPGQEIWLRCVAWFSLALSLPMAFLCTASAILRILL